MTHCKILLYYSRAVCGQKWNGMEFSWLTCMWGRTVFQKGDCWFSRRIFSTELEGSLLLLLAFALIKVKIRFQHSTLEDGLKLFLGSIPPIFWWRWILPDWYHPNQTHKISKKPNILALFSQGLVLNMSHIREKSFQT